ncbi:hypothetical protein PSQ90_01450 [Devosia rhodophyticola]|uniref:Uncharacterized protein n=1 Tax=Devosia rhodophyticola TaxID=3026423 RepID=A0ABY7YY48_9HYPH|nr:hypothetical protein [Devosia rhodophyticola]WDR06152.1 hypothetical protein PSQ90_01450 [Devosia rhodophyticola]
MAAPVIESAEGITLTTTGLVILKEHHLFVERVLRGQLADPPRASRLMMTLNHETVHFIQCFTASIPYSFSLHLRELASQFMKDCREGHMSADLAAGYRKNFASSVAQYASPYQGLSTLDLLEAMAVTEGYRATVHSDQNTAARFRIFLERDFPEPQSEYRRAIDIVTKLLGNEAGYELTPRLCYIALNGDTPAKNFYHMVEALAVQSGGDVAKMTACDLLDRFGMTLGGALLAQFQNGVGHAYLHPVFAPFIAHLSDIGDLAAQYEFAAKPGALIRQRTPEVESMNPPLVACSGGAAVPLGIGMSWPIEQAHDYLNAAAMIGAYLRLMSGHLYAQTCQKADCPIHRSALCHAWYAKPQTIDWTECAFPKQLELHFGPEAQDLLASFGPDQDNDPDMA